MLVLSRFKNETIFIGDDIKITLVDIRGHKVRIGVDAPDGVVVVRSEIADPNHSLHAAGGEDTPC